MKVDAMVDIVVSLELRSDLGVSAPFSARTTITAIIRIVSSSSGNKNNYNNTTACWCSHLNTTQLTITVLYWPARTWTECVVTAPTHTHVVVVVVTLPTPADCTWWCYACV